MKGELTARQWALYRLLKNNPDRRLKQTEIALEMKEWYAPRTLNDFHNTTTRVLITDDIRAINNSDVIQKIIVSNRNGVKLASKEEFEKQINAEFAAIFRRLERVRKKAKKGGLDKQMRVVFGDERDTIEAFTEDINRLKAARLNRGLKLVDVVAELRKTEPGIDIPLLSKMENGHCVPTKSVLLKLAQIYATSPESLLGGKVIATDETA